MIKPMLLSSLLTEVQEKGYVASFPSLINVSGEATYIMVLKDANGIVKMHALVNVENYSIVATGVTQSDAKQAYIELLKQEGIIKEEEVPTPPAAESKSAEVTVEQTRIVTISGESWAYFYGSDGFVYKKMIREDESVLLIQDQGKYTLVYTETENEKIRQIVSWN